LRLSIVVVSAIALLAFDLVSEAITHPFTDKIAIRLPLFLDVFLDVDALWSVQTSGPYDTKQCLLRAEP